MASLSSSPLFAADPPNFSKEIKVCQVGYLPDESKFAMITSSASGDANVRRSSDSSIVLSVPIATATKDANSTDMISAIDFSKLSDPGTYYLEVPGVGRSYDFQIGDGVFAHPFRLAMRMYTGQRCGIAVSLAPDFPQFHHEACHTEPAHFDQSAGRDGDEDCTGGWHDAGDYGRYIVNSGITTGTLLWAYEFNADKLKPINLDIPESHGPIPDVLAEIKWNIDWMLKMQDKDGGVWAKATTAKFPEFIAPEADKLPMLIVGNGMAPYKTTTATADLAAVTAIAGRVYAPFDKAYADRCLAAAKLAWAWLDKTPDNNFRRNPVGITTGAYQDNDPSDERFWAAAELFRTTGDGQYNTYVLAHWSKWKLADDAPQAWASVANLGLYTYALSTQSATDANVVSQIKAQAIAAADGIVARAGSDGYRIPLRARDYIWGSNSVVANYAMMVLIADRFSPKAQYVNCAADTLHYLFGRNTFDTSYVTWVGSAWPQHPHHRPTAGSSGGVPWPGMLVGGPNNQSGRGMRGKAPAKAWEDKQENFTVNEIAINWNAPLVFVLADAMK